MANPFVEGYRQSVSDTQNRKANDIAIDQSKLDLERTDFDFGQDRVAAERGTEAYNYLRERFGPAAGNPTAAGQLEGIEQRRTAHENTQTDREEERARAAHLRAIDAIEGRVKAGEDATAAIMGLPPGYREAQGITDEVAQQLGEAIQNDPAAIEALRAGIVGRPEAPEYEEGVDPKTGKSVFFTRDPSTNAPVIVDGVRPEDPSSGSSSGYFAPTIKDGVVYIRPKNGPVQAIPLAVDMAAEAAARTRGATTTATETAKADVKAIEALPAAIQSSENMMLAIDEVLDDPNTELAVGSPSFDKMMKGGTGGFGFEWPGSDAADAAGKIQYLQSAAFKEAFETLKGGGPITEVEGKAATEAYADVMRTRSPVEFKRKLRVFRNRVQELRDAKEARAARIIAGEVQPSAAEAGQGGTPEDATPVMSWEEFFANLNQEGD